MKKLTIFLFVFVMILPMLNAQGSAIDFTAVDVNGNTIKLSQYKDKLILLDFWATWCPPCRKEIPNLIKIKEMYKDAPFEIVSIALERHSEEKAKQFVKDNKMNWIHVIDNTKARQIAESYRIVAIPTMYLIKNGKILASNLRGHELSQKIKQLLEK